MVKIWGILDITLQELYAKYKDKEDEFLYLYYSDCEVFGKWYTQNL